MELEMLSMDRNKENVDAFAQFVEPMMPALYTRAKLGEINTVRQEIELESLSQDETTPRTFRRQLFGIAELDNDMYRDSPFDTRQRSLKAYYQLKRMPSDQTPRFGESFALKYKASPGLVDVLLHRDGVSVTIDIVKTPTVHEINMLSELFDTTTQRQFFALFTCGNNIICHETSLFGLTRVVIRLNQISAGIERL